MLTSLFLWLSWQGPSLALGPPEPIYHIEQIVLSRHRYVSRSIVLAQTRMHEGESYPESFLREAMARVRQLPFIRDARFQLERGSVRGKYRLNIRLEEAFPLFFDLDVRRSKLRPDTFFDEEAVSLGARQFLGKSALVYASFQPPWRKHVNREELRQSYVLGFSEFDLLGRGIFFDVSAEVLEGGVSPFGDIGSTRHKPTHRYFLNLAYPLGEHQWLRAEASFQRRQLTFQRSVDDLTRIRDDRLAIFEVSWELNTTDDAFRPQRGSLLRAGIGWSGERYDVNDNGVRQVDDDLETRALFGEWQRFLPLSRNHTLFGGVDFRADLFNGSGSSLDELNGGLIGGYQYRPAMQWLNRRLGNWYLGATIGLRYNERDSESSFVFQPGDIEGSLAIESIRNTSISELFVSWRGKWGLLRFSYRWERSTFKSTVVTEGLGE